MKLFKNFGLDKYAHIAACFMITAVTEIVCNGVFEISQFPSQLIGFGTAMGVGVIKEVVDKIRGGKFDTEDLVADAIGSVAAFLCGFGM